MKKKILALSLILSLAALSGCAGDEKTNTTIPPRTSELAAEEPEKTSSETSETEEIEPEREIKTSASTYEEVIAYFLTAFCEKDTEALESFGVDYDKSFNVLCKALDDTGNLPDDLSEIELSPEMFEVYYQRNSDASFENWEATYPLVKGKFTFHFKFSEYDYVSETYSVQSVKCKDHLSSDSLSLFRECSDSGEPLPGGIAIERLDITPYLDTKEIEPEQEIKASEPEQEIKASEPEQEIKASEPEREIKTSAQTHEELIAYLLTAFCEKDTEALESFGVDYDKSFNDLCKALDDTGNLPDDLSEIELSPELFEIYYTINALGTVEQWSAAYPNMGGRFGFWFYFSDYNYSTQTYTMQNVKCKELGNYSYFVKYADSDETWSGTVVKKVDITDYLD